MSFLLTNSSIPKRPSSRPNPDRIEEDAVDEDYAGVDRISDSNRLLRIGGEHVRAQLERGVVREGDGFLLGGDGEDHRHRAEELFAEREARADKKQPASQSAQRRGYNHSGPGAAQQDG